MNASTPILDTDAVVDFFDAALPADWTRQFDRGPYSDEHWFTLGSSTEPTARIVVLDGELIVYEFVGRGVLESTSRFSGNLRSACTRALSILGL